MKQPAIVTVGSGKGGSGKSTIAVNTGVILSRTANTVGFIDADTAGANLHHMLGIKRPAAGLADFLLGRTATLNSCIIETPIEHTWLLSGLSDSSELADLGFARKQKLIRHIRSLRAEIIFVDLPAGSARHGADFFAAFESALIVIENLPTSIENAYGFLKNGIIRGLSRLFASDAAVREFLQRFSRPADPDGFATIHDMIDALTRSDPDAARTMKEWLSKRKTFLVLNMVHAQDDIKIVGRFSQLVKKYLDIRPVYIGYVIFSQDIRRSVKAMTPAVLCECDRRVSGCFESIAHNLLSLL